VLAPAASAAAPPTWLVKDAHRAAAGLSDHTVPTKIEYVAPRSRFPIVVLRGSFVCKMCSYPPGGSVPKAMAVEIRYDGKTHESTDISMCPSSAGCGANLCSFGSCTTRQDALDAAFEAFNASLRGIPGDPNPFSAAPGVRPCHIHYPTAAMKYVAGTCTTAVHLNGLHAAAVTLTERWRPREYEHGRWVRLAVRSHTWQIAETDDLWKVSIRSSGDAAPQLPPTFAGHELLVDTDGLRVYGPANPSRTPCPRLLPLPGNASETVVRAVRLAMPPFELKVNLNGRNAVVHAGSASTSGYSAIAGGCGQPDWTRSIVASVRLPHVTGASLAQHVFAVGRVRQGWVIWAIIR